MQCAEDQAAGVAEWGVFRERVRARWGSMGERDKRGTCVRACVYTLERTLAEAPVRGGRRRVVLEALRSSGRGGRGGAEAGEELVELAYCGAAWWLWCAGPAFSLV